MRLVVALAASLLISATAPRPTSVETAQATLSRVFGRTVTGATLAGRYIPDLTTYWTTPSSKNACVTRIFRKRRSVQVNESYFAGASDVNEIPWVGVASVTRGPMADNPRQPDAIAINGSNGRVINYNFNSAPDRDEVYEAMNALVVACRR